MKWFPPLKEFWKKSSDNKKIKLIAVFLMIGILLLLFPSPSKKSSNPQEVNTINQQPLPTGELEKLLTDITGNKVKVLVSVADSGTVEVISEETFTSETKSAAGDMQKKRDIKPILDADKNIQIKNKKSPKIKGVCVFCFGTYSRETEELLYRAAKSSLGAELHTVEVIFKSYPTN